MKKLILASILIVSLTGCATTYNNPQDPYEGFNRAMFSTHEAIDNTILKPVAKGYDYIAPAPVKTGVSNFFSNIGDVPNMANNLLQGNIGRATNDFFRVVINSTIGILGFFDPATVMGLDKSEQDFGITLAKWGVGEGNYIFLPVIGPGSPRDTTGKLVDFAILNPIAYVGDIPARNSLTGGQTVDKRTTLLPTDKVVDEAALDKYAYIRDAYKRMRYYKINGAVMPSDDTEKDE